MEGYSKVGLKELRMDDVELIHLIQGREKLRDRVNTSGQTVTFLSLQNSANTTNGPNNTVWDLMHFTASRKARFHIETG
jgi:hypothetical protein